MRIALISYEYPIDTGGGGIGTYLRQVAGMLTNRGHAVVVFCGTTGPSRRQQEGGVEVILTAPQPGQAFNDAVAPVFTACHARQQFDVIEGCDFDASALRIKQHHPAVPYVVKMHTPRFFVDEIHQTPVSLWNTVRVTAGALRRGRLPRTVAIRDRPAARDEIAAIQLADMVAAPSRAIAEAVRTWCSLAPERVQLFPYPFAPSAAVLNIPADTATNRVTFLGRMEKRKGVIDLADAIPLVVRRHPEVKFRFVGRNQPSPNPDMGMHEFLARRLAGLPVEILDPVPHTELPRLLGETDITVFPSHWENHAMVCCEALAAARGVVASNNGGMREILANGKCGLLVAPHHPLDLAEAISQLLAEPATRRQFGEAGRRHVLEEYSEAHVLPLQLACYEAAITACRGTAPQNPPTPQP